MSSIVTLRIRLVTTYGIVRMAPMSEAVVLVNQTNSDAVITSSAIVWKTVATETINALINPMNLIVILGSVIRPMELFYAETQDVFTSNGFVMVQMTAGTIVMK